MGRRDYRWREPQKPKKGAKKASKPSILPTPVSVEVVKRERRERAEE